MGTVQRGLVAGLLRRLNLRFPTLFLVLGAVTLLDILVPDVIPFADEIVFALLTALVGTWKKRRDPPAPPSGS